MNAAAVIKFFAGRVRRLFEDGVFSRAVFIVSFVTSTVNLLLNSNS